MNESDSDGDEEEAEHDEILMDAVTDLLPAMASCMGPAFEPYFRLFFEPLMKFAVSSVSLSRVGLCWLFWPSKNRVVAYLRYSFL
jgi:hypothetical protein